ncbi:MAG: AAA family ATPase [Lachnospiraceae bacterium]|nr:AAA family ATPase [Lachnospiraceae bacterium]
MSIMFPLGIESFPEVRDGKYYYVDKTEFLKDLLGRQFKANLITRPRRFGKTLTMSMLEDYFDISRESTSHFAGLKISEDEALKKQWMNQWPVIFLTLKSVEGSSFENAYGMLKVLLSGLCKKYTFLETSERVDEDDKVLFRELKSQTSSMANVKDSLYALTRMLNAHYGKQTILLIDEYDVPLANASENGYYKEMLELLRGLLGKALKTNEYLKFSVVTGCLRIAKESLFTGINNFVTDSITGDRFNECIGFTDEEVKRILEDTGFSGHMEEMRSWYDGYRFGDVNVYCPWDVLNHVSALQEDPRRQPKNYWGSTSHNGAIYRFISREELDVNQKFETLLSGGTITEEITDELTYDTLNSSEKNLWSLLYLTGYLTLAEGGGYDGNRAVLRIPNEEVKSIFKTAIVDWFHDSIQLRDRKPLFDALWSGDAETAMNLISDILFDTISFHDYKESYYHAFIAGIFSGAGYMVKSNYEDGLGRSDVVITDRKNRRAILIEAKHSDSEKRMDADCIEALEQIREKKYKQSVERGYRQVTAYGIAFWGKECRMKLYQEENEKKEE